MKDSHIQWTNHTFNPWIGCTKVSPGCLHCYAEARDLRFDGGKHWGKGAPRRRTSSANWTEPIKWNREALGATVDPSAAAELARLTGQRPRVFCASLADWLDDEVPVLWLADLLHLIRQTPNLDWLLLSKRPENCPRRLTAVLAHFATYGGGDTADWLIAWLDGKAPANVWIGATVEDQTRAFQRVPAVLAIPARVRFLSCEPMLGPISLAYTCFNGADSFGTMPGINWVICGGESGKGARPMQEVWAADLRKECAHAGVAFFMKQLGGERDKRGDIATFPPYLQVREFPTP